VNKSILEQELAPLEAQIEQARQKLETLKGELCAVEAEHNTFSADRERFDALGDVCAALDRLGEMEADGLFWDEIPGVGDPARQLEKVRVRVADFEEETRGVVEKQQSVQVQINQCLDELYILEEEVRDAYDRDERRREEFILERKNPNPRPKSPNSRPKSQKLLSNRKTSPPKWPPVKAGRQQQGIRPNVSVF